MAHQLSTDCSCREPGFQSKHSHSGSQLPVTPVTEDLVPSSDLHRDQAHKRDRHTRRQTINTIKEIKYINFKN